jgi:hypothetical protein
MADQSLANQSIAECRATNAFHPMLLTTSTGETRLISNVISRRNLRREKRVAGYAMPSQEPESGPSTGTLEIAS